MASTRAYGPTTSRPLSRRDAFAAGTVGINEWASGDIELPFDGYRNSRYGREKGIAAGHHYTQTTTVCAKLARA